MNLQDSTAITLTEGRYSACIDPDWSIWGPNGGYVAAIALRAVGLAAPAGHRPVTLTCQFLARGDNGPVDILVDPVKTGSTAFFNVTLLQNGTRFFQAQICTTAKSEGPDKVDISMPAVPPPDALETFAAQLERFGHKANSFWQNVDGRQVDFRTPGDPDPRGARTECWLRFVGWAETADPFLDAARTVIGIDVSFWRAYSRGLSELPDHVAPSLDLTVWFHDAAPASPWQLVEARADFARHALLGGSARVWSIDGQLVATGGSQCLFVPMKRT
jgi:acyl-CoA thioesterase II